MKSITCPECNGTNIAEIVWGLPSQKFMEEYNKEKNKGKYRLKTIIKSNNKKENIKINGEAIILYNRII